VDKAQTRCKAGPARSGTARRVRVGRPWDGTVDVEVQRFTLLGRVIVILAVLLGMLALRVILANDAALARQLLSLVRDLLLIIVGGLVQPFKGRH